MDPKTYWGSSEMWVKTIYTLALNIACVLIVVLLVVVYINSILLYFTFCLLVFPCLAFLLLFSSIFFCFFRCCCYSTVVHRHLHRHQGVEYPKRCRTTLKRRKLKYALGQMQWAMRKSKALCRIIRQASDRVCVQNFVVDCWLNEFRLIASMSQPFVERLGKIVDNKIWNATLCQRIRFGDGLISVEIFRPALSWLTGKPTQRLGQKLSPKQCWAWAIPRKIIN